MQATTVSAVSPHLALTTRNRTQSPCRPLLLIASVLVAYPAVAQTTPAGAGAGAAPTRRQA